MRTRLKQYHSYGTVDFVRCLPHLIEHDSPTSRVLNSFKDVATDRKQVANDCHSIV